MRKIKKEVFLTEEVKQKIHNEAHYIENHSDFSFSDASGALERGLEHYLYLSENEDVAWEKAQELVAGAVLRARENGFDLLGMTDNLLFSLHHRVQRDFRL